MTAQPMTPDGTTHRPGPPAFLNRLMLAVLRSPLHRVASGGVLLLDVRGRRTGRLVRLPVQYAADGDRLVVVAAEASRKRWWRNLVDGAPVGVVHRGRRLEGHGRVLRGEAAADALAAWRRRYPGAAAGTDHAVVVIDALRPAR